MRAKLTTANDKILRLILKIALVFACTLAGLFTFSSFILNSRPIADDYGHIAHFSEVGTIDYARGFFMGIDSHPLSVLISTSVNLVLTSIGLVPGYALLVALQTLLFLLLVTFLISHTIRFNPKTSSNYIYFFCAILLLMLTLNFSGSTTQSPYRAYALIGWVNFFWQHIPLNLLQVLLFLRWKRNLWVQKDTINYILVFLLALWGPIESLTTLGMFIFITLAQFKKQKFALFKANNSQYYFSFIILFLAAIFTIFAPSSAGRRDQYAREVRVGQWYERFVGYNLLSFREIIVYGLFAAFLSFLIGFVLGSKKILSAKGLSFWNLMSCLICLVFSLNFAETFSYFAPFHHTIFSFVFVLSSFVGGVELGMKKHGLNLWVWTILSSTIIFSMISFYSPGSTKAFNYRQTWDATQVLIVSKCTDDITISGISKFLPGSSMNPDWNFWSCKNGKWFDGISNSLGSIEDSRINPSAKLLNSTFDNSLSLIVKLIYGGDSGESKILGKFEYYSY